MMKILELNTFHMHLSDDQGWRLEIEELPELTTFGAKRCYGNFSDGITNDFPCLWPEPQGERPLLTVVTARVFVMGLKPHCSVQMAVRRARAKILSQIQEFNQGILQETSSKKYSFMQMIMESKSFQNLIFQLMHLLLLSQWNIDIILAAMTSIVKAFET